jgi:hypothetical protein
MSRKDDRIKNLEDANDALHKHLAIAIEQRDQALKANAALRVQQSPWWVKARDELTAKAQDALDRVGLGL